MNCTVRDFLLTIAWRFPWSRALSSSQPVILMYHGIPSQGNGTGFNATTFEQHIMFLEHHFKIVSPTSSKERRNSLEKIRVVLTFDDGFRNHAEVVAPILRRHHVPARFFVCSRHATPGKYLWFAYLEALERHFSGNGFYFGGEFINMSSDKRHGNMIRLRETLLNLEPHPAAMYEIIDDELPCLGDFVSAKDVSDHFAGMTEEQIGDLTSDRLFSLGIHTVDHPFLPKCASDEAQRQIFNNKIWIEQISNKPCNAIAYPAGRYNSEILELCRSLGLTAAYAQTPTLNADTDLEIPRIGIYSTSLPLVGFKVHWGNAIEPLRYLITGRL